MNVPPDAKFISWREYMNRQWALWREEAAALHPPGEIPEISRKAIATPRERYGWRGLSAGSRMLDKEKK
jgi:hypothetical protein